MKHNKANERAMRKQAKHKQEMNAAAMSSRRPNSNASDWFRCPAYQAHATQSSMEKHDVLGYLGKKGLTGELPT